MLGGVSIPTKIISAIDPDLLKHAGKGMGMCQKGFGNWPRGMLGGVSIPIKIVLAIYPHLPSHVVKVQACAKSVSVTCEEMYPYPLKLFREFMVTSAASQQRYGHVLKVFW